MRNQGKNRNTACFDWSRIRGLFTLILFSLIVTACASKAVVPETSDEVVVERAKARWAAMLNKDMETAYSYYSPGYRSTTSLVDFMFKQRARRVRWESAEYRDHECTEDACKVRFKTGFRVEKVLPGVDTYHGTDVVEETWVRTQGQWWYIPPKG